MKHPSLLRNHPNIPTALQPCNCRSPCGAAGLGILIGNDEDLERTNKNSDHVSTESRAEKQYGATKKSRTSLHTLAHVRVTVPGRS